MFRALDLNQPFWNTHKVFEFAAAQVTSTLCACLATHAAMKHFKGIERKHLGDKCWGVFSHRTTQLAHPLVRNINTRFNVPHSRYNDISKAQVEDSGMCVLVTSDVAGVHLAVSEDLFRFVFFQGHPEYDRTVYSRNTNAKSADLSEKSAQTTHHSR